MPKPKPWYKSLTVQGAVTAGLAIILSPDVLAVVPPKVASVFTVLGAVATAIGLRRALPPTP